ncbi:MAG: sensor histidine kinase, partial [Anaerolineales bacterium]
LLCQPDFAPSPDDMELIAAMGAQASEIVANAWLHARLVEKEAARRALLESLVRTQEDERSRLALELHDGAGQTLTTLLVRLKALEKQAPPGLLHDGLVRLQDLAAGSIEQVRDLSYELRPATLQEFGLARALETLLAETARPAGVEVQTHFALHRSLPKEVETALYRIAQESLTNVLRHAGAHRLAVELSETPLGVALRLEDDGCGFDPNRLPTQVDRRHLGLISMQERAEMLGGTLVVYSAPGAGTSVQVRVPVTLEAVPA